MKKFDYNSITVKYDHWFAPMIPFLKNKNTLYGKVIGKTIYFSEPKHVVLKRNDDGSFRFRKLMRHELEHIYQMDREGTFVYLVKYGVKWFINMFKCAFRPHKSYLEISYEKEARAAETKELTKQELEVFK